MKTPDEIKKAVSLCILCGGLRGLPISPYGMYGRAEC